MLVLKMPGQCVCTTLSLVVLLWNKIVLQTRMNFEHFTVCLSYEFSLKSSLTSKRHEFQSFSKLMSEVLVSSGSYHSLLTAYMKFNPSSANILLAFINFVEAPSFISSTILIYYKCLIVHVTSSLQTSAEYPFEISGKIIKVTSHETDDFSTHR